MNTLLENDINIPPNEAKKIYPVAQSMVISLFIMVTLLGLDGQIPDLATLSQNFNIFGPGVTQAHASSQLPSRIVIPSLGIDSSIINPVQADIATLDRALLSGVVRYPGSGTLGAPGNVLLFGHSSHLKFVHNKAYQSFNDINTLEIGDDITIYGTSTSYKYRVTKVSEVKNTEGRIEMKTSGHKLTLVTCNNFGAKEDRYIVEALLIK